MNWLLNIGARFAGIGKAWEWVDGKKTYGVAILGVLSALIGLGTEAAPILAAHDTAGLFAFIRRLPTDQSWLMLLVSLKAFGIRHAIEKQESAAP